MGINRNLHLNNFTVAREHVRWLCRRMWPFVPYDTTKEWQAALTQLDDLTTGVLQRIKVVDHYNDEQGYEWHLEEQDINGHELWEMSFTTGEITANGLVDCDDDTAWLLACYVAQRLAGIWDIEYNVISPLYSTRLKGRDRLPNEALT